MIPQIYMKSILAFSLLLSLFTFIKVNDAGKGPEDYWESVMKDQPIPEAIKTLLHRDPPHFPGERKKDHFLKTFDTTPRAVVYHGHLDQLKEEKPYVEEYSERKKDMDRVDPQLKLLT
ncbi:hypothetical protein CJ030_MR7G011577 [Morella rubra]|uniref:Organ-specific protein S2 n=1 Tax=Morella rubra TaxID=262757 RepID=A0A6A1V4X1_9ROSI|nr:hypothetical protein CJ030_MR7G011577 [Morella rubra]